MSRHSRWMGRGLGSSAATSRSGGRIGASYCVGTSRTGSGGSRAGHVGAACTRVGRSGREAPVESSDEQLCRAVAEREAGSLRSPGGALPGAGLPHRLVRAARSRGRAGLLAGSVHPAPRIGRIVRGAVEVLDLVLPDPGQLLPGPAAAPARLAAARRLARSARGRGRDEPDPVEQAPAPFTDPVDGMDTERRMSRVWALVETSRPSSARR